MTKFFFCMTVDTEPDDLWRNTGKQTFRHFDQLLSFHENLAARGARPTYLTTSEVVENQSSRKVMERIVNTGTAKIGAHFHSWTRSWPFQLPDLGTPPVHANAHQLGQSYEEQMLDYTCRATKRTLGIQPTSFRGGRWSLNGQSVKSLTNCGINVDTTITPGISWEDSSHPLQSGPDFRDYPRYPFYVSRESLEPKSEGSVLELPVGSNFIPDRTTALDHSFPRKVTRKVWNTLGRSYGALWLRPTLQSSTQLRCCLKGMHRDSVPVWVAMIHSSEIIPCKPLPTEREVSRFIDRCYTLVDYARKLGATCETLEEVRSYYERKN